MFLVSFSETRCYCIEYKKFCGRSYSGVFCKDIAEAVNVFKRHYFSLADKIVKSNVYMSAKVDFSNYVLLKDDSEKYCLVLTPVKVNEGDYCCYFNTKRSWNYVSVILGFTPEFILCHLDDEPKKKENK